MTDWNAVTDDATNKQLLTWRMNQLNPQGLPFWAGLQALVESGEVPESLVNESAVAVLTPFMAVPGGIFDKPNSNSAGNNVSTAEHAELARTISSSGVVLLQNQGSLLPLDPNAHNVTILVVGGEANYPTYGGRGSGGVQAPWLHKPGEGIRRAAGIAPGHDRDVECNERGLCVHVYLGNDGDGNYSTLGEYASQADVTIVLTAANSGEGKDRVSLSLGRRD